MRAAERALAFGDYETATSRAYYAAFRAVVAVLEARLGVERKWNHYLAPYFARVPELTGLQETVPSLYLLRIQADYEEEPISRDQAENSLRESHLVVARAVEATRNA
jgi:uncharacterized protein (UPF0332 family)